ncbi:MAG: hypothetical protein AB7V04_05615 [Desulfomonilaceae bacterium]
MRETGTKMDEVAFEQAYEMLRHYGKGLMSIRAMTLVQGYAILAGIGFCVFQHQFCAGLFVSFFGILLTLALYGMHKNYITYYEDIRKCIKSYESYCALPEWEMYYFAVEIARDKRAKGNKHAKIKYLYGPFVLLIATMIFLGIICVLFIIYPTLAAFICPKSIPH